MTPILEYQCVVHAPAAEVYRAFTRATPLRDWLCDVALADARPEGRIYLWWNGGYYVAGEYTGLEQDRWVAFTWQGKDEPGRTSVDVVIRGQGEMTAIGLEHRGLGDGDGWERVAAEFDRGWRSALENLQSLLERGEDLRYTRRPMLGVVFDTFNAQIAAEMGVPVSEGVRLTSTIPGMAAANAGLAEHDVMVSLDGKPINDFPTYVTALQGKRAHDTVEIVFYRGKERMAAPVTLSPRRLPDIPPNPADLAAELRKLYTPLLAQLEAVLANVPHEKASFKPRVGAWSALEVVSHLIVTERETQSWLGDMINDDERFSDRYTDSTSVNERVAAVLAVYPTAGQLLRAAQDSLAETEAIVASLPDELVQHRGSYWRIGHNLLQYDEHWEEHLEQIEEALRAAG